MTNHIGEKPVNKTLDSGGSKALFGAKDSAIDNALIRDIPDPQDQIFGVHFGGHRARAKRIEHGILSTTKIGGSLLAIWWMVAYGSSWVEWSMFLVGYFVCMLGCIIGYHRFFSHRAFETSKPMGIFIGILTQLAAQGSAMHWAANHRRHHSTTDQIGDPHSPHFDSHGKPLKGFAGFHNAHVAWLFNNSTTDLTVYGKGLVDDEVVIFCHRTRWFWYFASVIIIPTLWALAFGGPEFIISTILIGGFLRIFSVLTALQSVNSVGHMFGSERFEGHGTAKNNLIVNILTLGDGWHNNHHRHPRSATAGVVWWEFDLCANIIRLWEKMGLVWNVKWAPRYVRDGDGNWVQAAETRTGR